MSFSFAYEVGETISTAHQNQNFPICYAPELDPNDDGIFNQLKDKFITKSKDKGGNN